VRTALARLGIGTALGVVTGFGVAGWLALGVDRDVAHGLGTLAAERALAVVGLHGVAGAIAGALAAVGGRVFRSGLLRVAAFVASALPIAAVAALCLHGGLSDARIPETVTRVRSPAGPNVLLVVMDTVRADRLGANGYARPTSPELDAFAREAIRFETFQAPAPWTLPSHASLFTGLYPMQHGATQEHLRLERRFATLAERLRDAGYRTFAASANPIVGPDAGLEQGFARFVEAWRPGDPAVHPVSSAFARFLGDADPARPYFAFLNYMEAHSPYTPPPALLQRFARAPVRPLVADRIGRRPWSSWFLDGPYPESERALLSDLYDAEIAQLSAELGRLFAVLHRDPRWSDTLVAVTSDHGEHFGERDRIEHMFSLYEPVLRVPLLLRLPGGARAGEVESRPGQLTDLAATVLSACGLDASSLSPQGVDLLAPGPRREELLAEYYFPRQVIGLLSPEELARAQSIAPHLRRLRAIRRGDRKLVWGSDGRHELYDLRADPGETRDLLAGGHDPDDARALEEGLTATLGRFGAPFALAPPRLDARITGLAEHADPETVARLRELGYVR
jgi:arylsulfatase A-like enzyme